MKYIVSLLIVIGVLAGTTYASTRSDPSPRQQVLESALFILEEIINAPDEGISTNRPKAPEFVPYLESGMELTNFDSQEIEYGESTFDDETELPPTSKAIMNPTPLPLW